MKDEGRFQARAYDLSVVIALLAAPAVALLLSLRPVGTYDLGFILKSGELIAKQGIPTTDPFSFTRAGAPWYYEQPLGALAFFSIWRVVGLTGLIVVKAATIAAAFGLAVWAAFSVAVTLAQSSPRGPHAGTAYFAALAAVPGVLAVSTSAWRFFEQPFVFSFVLLALVLLLVERHRVRPRWQTLAALVPVFTLWPLVHVGYFYGLALLGCYALGAAISWELGRYAQAARWLTITPRRSAVQLVTVAALCGAAAIASLALFHPQGLNSLVRVWSVFAGDMYRQKYEEMGPLVATYGINAATIMLWAGPPVFWLGARRPVVPAHVLAYGVFVFCGLQVGRLVTEVSLVLVPIWAAGCASLVSELHHRGFIATLAKKLTPQRVAWTVIAAVAFAGANYVRLGFGRNLTWSGNRYPRACYAWISQSELPPRMFNDMLFGGSFIFHFYPTRQVFIDGRTVYDEEFFRNVYEPIKLAAPGWRETVRNLGIEWFLLSPHRFAPLHRALRSSPDWRRVFADDNCVIYANADFVSHQAATKAGPE